MANGPSHGGTTYACLFFILDEAKEKVAFLEGATAHTMTMVSMEALWVDGSSRECKFLVLIKEIDSILTGELVFFLYN
jgi:hypothetical protein